ncbi:MAG: 2-oxoacid:acceptor oxidoreductase family protein [Lentisphaeria bacterium]|jgi:indolepyruvate ferredoxin oxidoreductase beta subunit|nr:pyruvate ferredoxin oxidoreductase [Lentisphaerota bacterium]MBO5802273.1 2-oxoacid:acceptor oxidoreductase family protein [Lentisphaeria bacterium]MBO5958923.1 2-oxoacid:acceptor oxidoreductase family protein [Lentisphaeria bacterium]MBR4884341.1 2-oxoacid:acceptor oxidoreductase family protein [Lentisphaeria bacterium]
MKNGKVTNVMFAGIGGQGIIRASDMLTEAAFRMGCDVKKSELHGMSQRGGSVSSDVRFGEKVASPMIPAGEADYMIAVSADQIEVCAAFLNENTVIIRDEDIPEEYRASRMMNIAMLGVLNRYLAFPEELWIDLIRENFSGTVAEENITAFRRAFEAK